MIRSIFTGCGPFPIFSKWRLQNGSEAGNESLVGETYFSECSDGHKQSIVMYCGPDTKWQTNYSTCETDKCGKMQKKEDEINTKYIYQVCLNNPSLTLCL